MDKIYGDDPRYSMFTQKNKCKNIEQENLENNPLGLKVSYY
jgi:hypothetical protein